MNRGEVVVIGLDVGARRIGVARGDFDVKVASPLKPLINDEKVFENLKKIIESNSSNLIVVGLPRNSEGQETKQSQFSRQFAAEIEKEIGGKVVFQDESLTSVTAEQNLRSRKDFNEIMLRDGTLDSESAALILTDFLERGPDAYA